MRRGRPPYEDTLTPREWEVLALIREGLSNQEIADRLGISHDGAKYHVAEILSKLGVASRQEAASWQPDKARSLTPLSFLSSIVFSRFASLAVFLLLAALVAIQVAGLDVERSKSANEPEPAPLEQTLAPAPPFLLPPPLLGEYRPIPDLGDSHSRLPRPLEVSSSGSCEITAAVTNGVSTLPLPAPMNSYRQPSVSIKAIARCPLIIPTADCPPGAVHTVQGYQLACDRDGLRIGAYWNAHVDDTYVCTSSGTAFLDGGLFLSGANCEYASQFLTSGSSLHISVCFSLRDDRSCSQFPYTLR
jgi:DNA-binding CsgD family transcriptional regulator